MQISSMVSFGSLALATLAVAHAAQPHIMLIIGDDVGYNSVGFHGNNQEVKTPRMDSLAKEGVIFDRMYAFAWCSPSRASIMSGRVPAHVYQQAGAPIMPDLGLPLGMTTLPDKLKEQGYATVQAGKWHLGFGRESYIPVERGFDSSFGYFAGAENHFTQKFCSSQLCLQAEGGKIEYDLWLDHDAGYGLMRNDTSEFGDDRWTKHVIDFIDANPAKPIFAYLALQAAHSPLQAPDEALAPYDVDMFKDRRLYNGMMTSMDGNIGRLVDHLKAKEMWNNTLLLFVSDNGGPVYYQEPGQDLTQGGGGSNNFPLRGGKLSLLEGGMRVTSFAAGGVLPAMSQGSHVPALAAIADIYATLAILGGADLSDTRAKAAGLPSIDGVDLMPMLRGEATSARTQLTLALNFTLAPAGEGSGVQQGSAIIDGDLKLITGKVPFYFDQSPTWPVSNYSWVWDEENYLDCGQSGCLFDIISDPSEKKDLASARPNDLARMQQLLSKEMAKKYEAPPGKPGPIGIIKFMQAVKKRNGILGPWAGSADVFEV